MPLPDNDDEPRGSPELADFKVHFYRKLQTNAGVQDAQLSVGDVCDIGFSYNANFIPIVEEEPAPEPEPEPFDPFLQEEEVVEPEPEPEVVEEVEAGLPLTVAHDQKAYYNYILD